MDDTLPTQQNSDDMTPEEMTSNLHNLMDKVTQKYNTFHGQKKSLDTQIAKSQNDAIAALFQILQKNGVDPANQDEVNKFLQQLQQENPEGYQMFEAAIDNLLSQKKTAGQQAVPDGIAEPLNTEEQQAVEPVSPTGIDPNAPVNDVSKIPLGPVAGAGQPVNRPPASPPPAFPPGMPG